MSSHENFWMYDVTQLFRSYDLLPSHDDTLTTKLNTITRLAMIVCIVIAAYKPVLGFSTMIIVMVITMSVHSSMVPDPNIERFEPGNDTELSDFMKEYKSTSYPNLNRAGFPTTQKRFCNDAEPLEYGPHHISLNQQLAGGPNPKTKIPPIIAPPSHDLDSWRNNDFVVHSQINKDTNFDADLSGYGSGTASGTASGTLMQKCTECMYIPCQCKSKSDVDVIEGYGISGHRGSRGRGGDKRGGDIRGGDNRGGDKRWGDKHWGGKHRPIYVNINENEDEPQVKNKPVTKVRNEPSCFETPRRDNIITQTLQPGVFQKSHIGEPIQSNIGISYNQQWGPTEVNQTDNMIKYTMHDPKNITNIPQIQQKPIVQDYSNVYDPRFTGYGTSYRSYTDKLTGRPKYFYDDIDAITMPNYITRSKVDIFPWGNTYGSDTKSIEGDELRQLANNAFHDSTILFRTELQERLMRKRNAELWQRRVAPISTMGRLGSSMRSCL
jgi:hypothetical protein